MNPEMTYTPNSVNLVGRSHPNAYSELPASHLFPYTTWICGVAKQSLVAAASPQMQVASDGGMELRKESMDAKTNDVIAVCSGGKIQTLKVQKSPAALLD